MAAIEGPRDETLGFGVVAGLPADLLTTIARDVDRLGYGSLWINDSGRPDTDGLAGLAVAAAAAPRLQLGVGVLPLDRRNPADIAAAVTRLGLPLDRLRLGVGSGAAVRSLSLVRDGVTELRERLPQARLFISALGPRMSRLAGEIADGVLFNWAVPGRIVETSRLVGEGAAGAAGDGSRYFERWAYVRCAVGSDARDRVAAEGRRYAAIPAYGRAFQAMGVPFEQVGVAGDDLAAQLVPYRRVLDGVVVRALPPQWTIEDALAVARAAGPKQAAG